MFCLSELAGGTPLDVLFNTALLFILVTAKFTSAPRYICNITAPLEDAFVDYPEGCLFGILTS